MPAQVSALLPNALASRTAISGEIPRLPLSRLLRACRVTPNTLAPSVTVNPSGSRQSCRTVRPGCGGFFIAMSPSPFSVIVDQINIGYVTVIEAKDDAPVGTDGDAPKAGEVAFQQVQPEARKG